ncbi:tRNA (guanine-N(7)-)-methyltransferase non-catalytic subunit wuho [Leptidea sinapis]|uniref:Uncharacterized protein n=1 Tax=Leptidea sinapis TaxID=189913 RepID=A0A5E4R419_9NEOP|nr:tRNA (guanine-N(7)-)-methyltransferase non-catalytic subunit wuho [Leptidea sinapis]VVD05106.1 unnamed protein product [Leptidea sinapis]
MNLAVNDTVIVAAKGNFVDCYSNSNHNVIDTGGNITDMVISNDDKYLGLLLDPKQLQVYELPQMILKKTFILPRSASKIRFGVENTHLFVADKTGDVLFYDTSSDESGVKLLGHLSLLLNILQSKDSKYLITSDRDEKIKVSHYPNTYSILTYCLGHKEFVNHIEFLPHDERYLLSSSGDGTIKCWDYIKGHLCSNIETKNDIQDDLLKDEFKNLMDSDGIEVDSLPIVHLSSSQLNNTTSLIAATIHSIKEIFIYSLETTNLKFYNKLCNKISIENFPASIIFHKLSLYVLDSTRNNINVYKFSENQNIISTNIIDMFVSKNIAFDKINDFELIKVLFKRKFDNVQEYQERKKRRLGGNLLN